MTTRERRPELVDHQRTKKPGETDAPAEPTPRETGEAFLSAADAAIERALSGRAEAFLRQNRQLGGQ